MKLNERVSVEYIDKDRIGEILDSLLEKLNLKCIKTTRIEHGDDPVVTYWVTEKILRKAEGIEGFPMYEKENKEFI